MKTLLNGLIEVLDTLAELMPIVIVLTLLATTIVMMAGLIVNM